MSLYVCALTPAAMARLLVDPEPPALRDPATAHDFAGRALAARFGHVDGELVDAAWFMETEAGVQAAWGVIPHWPGRAEGWMVFVASANRRMRVRATREAARCLAALQRHAVYRRVEMWVRDDQPWARGFGAAMGMRQESRSPCWGPDGSDFGLWASVRGMR